MFSLSAKSVYGLTAMTELAMKHGMGPVQIRDIAEAHGIPQHYLEQLLVLLKKTGLVESFRGSRGGYSLARDPSAIKVLEVMSSLEGKLEVVSEPKKNGMLDFFWNRLESGIRRMLDLTLEEIILERQSLDKAPMYNI